MKTGALIAALLLHAGVALSQTQSPLTTRADARPGAMALAGGTLIDGFGGPPLRNSLILIEGERITRVGTVGSLPIPAGKVGALARGNAGPLFWTPTIEGLFNYEYLRDNPEALDDPSWHLGLPDPVIADIRASIVLPDRLPYFQVTPSRRPTLGRKFQQLRESGVVLLVGTDAGIPMKFHSQATWNELEVWVNRLGVDPLMAIRAATWPAVAMKV